MGEAKRRRERERSQGIRPPTAKNIVTGELVQIRPTGMTATEYTDELSGILRGGGRMEVRVPCNGCRECCWHHRVDVDPEEESAEDLAHLSLDHDEVGYFLSKRGDGGCVHLGESGCTVHQHRPLACRGYDCRMASLAGLVETFDDGHHQPTWKFHLKTTRDKAVALALRLGVRPFIGGDGRLSLSVSEVLVGAQRNYQKNYAVAYKLAKAFDELPYAERRAMVEEVKALDQRK